MNTFFSSSPICKRCGQPIQGAFLSALGATWHPEHFVCAACNQPIRDTGFTVQDGLPYHTACYRDCLAPRCAYCGKPLVDEYLIDHWGTKFCKEHEGQYPHCAYCGRLVPPQQQEQGASRNENVRCPVCRSTAIETSSEAQSLFRNCIQWVSGKGLKYNNLRLSLELVNRVKLAQYLSAHTEPHALGATMSATYMQDGHVMRTEVSGIAALQGLPSTLFQGVTIHELGHVWLVVQGISGLPLWAEEGFCELLSYYFYTEMNTPESSYHAQNIERNPNQVYGEGFRRVRALAERMGFQQFIEKLRTTKRLP